MRSIIVRWAGSATPRAKRLASSMSRRVSPSISLSLNAAQNLLFSIDTSHLPTSATVHVIGLPVVEGENRRGVGMNCANLMAKQVRWKGERWKRKRLVWLASLAFGPSCQPILSRAQQHEGRRTQAQESEREWGLGQERGQTWACLHVTRSSEHECGESRQANANRIAGMR